jgi:hypothetical protein
MRRATTTFPDANSTFSTIPISTSGAVLCGVDQARPAWAVHAGAARLCESINALVRSIRLVTSFRQLLREASSVMGVVADR